MSLVVKIAIGFYTPNACAPNNIQFLYFFLLLHFLGLLLLLSCLLDSNNSKFKNKITKIFVFLFTVHGKGCLKTLDYRVPKYVANQNWILSNLEVSSSSSLK